MYQYPKNILTIPMLLQKLKDAGMAIPSMEEAETAFTSIGYYRLKGYCFHLYDKSTNRYREDVSFSDILKLYHFDSELSHLLFDFLSQIEVALRARLVQALLIYHDPLIMNDPSVFDDKERYWKNQSAIASEIARSNDVFIKHNFRNHDGAIPLWATVEVMSFGTLSKVIKTLKTGSQSAFSLLAQHYPFQTKNGKMACPSKKMLTSWIQAVSVMRNICAHNSRIYNRVISTIPVLIASDVMKPAPQYSGLYQIMLSMKYLRPTDAAWDHFISAFCTLLNKYDNIVDVRRLNFPCDWEKHLIIS